MRAILTCMPLRLRDPPPQYSDEKPEDDGRIVPYSWHLTSKVQIR